MLPVLVDIQDVSKALFVEFQPLASAVFVELLGLDREPVRRQWAQKNAVEIELQIFVDDILRPAQTRLGGRHQRPNPVASEDGLSASNTLYGKLMTVAPRSRAIAVM